MTRKNASFFSRLQIPNYNISAPADQSAAVRAKGDRPHPARMPFKSAGALPVLHVRQTDRIVGASTSHTLPVRAKSHSINRAPVTCDNSSDLSGGEIPQTQSLVIAAASESFTVPAQGDGVYSSGAAPLKVRNLPPVLAFHKRTVLSSLQLARVLPSLLKAMALTAAV